MASHNRIVYRGKLEMENVLAKFTATGKRTHHLSLTGWNGMDADPTTLLQVAQELVKLAETLTALAGHGKPRTTSQSMLLTPKQVAAELGVSPSTVRSWIKSGDLPSIILGNPKARLPYRRVSRTDLEAFIESRRDKTIEPRAKPAPRAKKYPLVFLK